MASLKIENIPESLLKSLGEVARASGRSLDEQAIQSLAVGIRVSRRDRAWVEERLAAAKAVRDGAPNAWITDEDIRAARDEGRA